MFNPRPKHFKLVTKNLFSRKHHPLKEGAREFNKHATWQFDLQETNSDKKPLPLKKERLWALWRSRRLRNPCRQSDWPGREATRGWAPFVNRLEQQAQKKRVSTH
jgi:hypothetical protein